MRNAGIVDVLTTLGALLQLESSALAADPYSVADVVLAAQSGMPPSVLSKMATSRDDWALDGATVAKMLRSGVPAYVIMAMTDGAHPTEADVSAATVPGDAFPAPPKVPPDVDDDESLFVGYTVQGPSFYKGHVYMAAVTEHVVVSVSVVSDGPYTDVYLGVKNLSGEPVHVFPDSTRLFVRSEGTRTELERLPPTEFIKRQWNKADISMFLTAITLPVPTSTTSYGYASYADSYGATAAVGAVVTTSASTSDRVAADAHARDVLAAESAGFAARIQAQDDALLRANTVYTGEAVGGLVPFRYRSEPMTSFSVVVAIDGVVITLPGRTRE